MKVLKDEKASPFARAEAARLLGLLADAAAAPALRKVVAGEARRDTSRLATACARALATLSDAGGRRRARGGDARVGRVVRGEAHPARP